MAEEIYNLHNAILTFCLEKNDFFISAYAGKVVFGEIFSFGYIINKRFVIHRAEFKHFYNSIQDIVKFIASNKAQKGCITSTDRFTYTWEVTANKSINISIQKDNLNIYQTFFNHNEFNNLIYSFQKLCISSLLLKDDEVMFFQRISALPLTEIVSFYKDQDKFLTFLQKTSNDCRLCNLIFLFEMNIDIIVITNKLIKLIKNRDVDLDFLLQ